MYAGRLQERETTCRLLTAPKLHVVVTVAPRQCCRLILTSISPAMGWPPAWPPAFLISVRPREKKGPVQRTLLGFTAGKNTTSDENQEQRESEHLLLPALHGIFTLRPKLRRASTKWLAAVRPNWEIWDQITVPLYGYCPGPVKSQARTLHPRNTYSTTALGLRCVYAMILVFSPEAGNVQVQVLRRKWVFFVLWLIFLRGDERQSSSYCSDRIIQAGSISFRAK